MKKSLNLKGNGGITLIALVITIIVLIILAGISIAMISGQNGIISKAGAGAAANQLGAAKDKCALIASEKVNDVYDDVYVKHTSTAAEIGKKIDTGICTAINGNTEILNLLGGSGKGSAAVVATAPTYDTTKPNLQKTAGTITLTYSDGTKVVGTLNKEGTTPGVIEWGNITK